jgi:hypothetical protein
MSIYRRGSVQIHYEEAGSGFPLLVIPGGGLNATISYLSERTPFNPMSVLSVIEHMRDRQLGQIEPVPAAEDAWVAHVGEAAGRTLRYTCGSWYLGAKCLVEGVL